MTMSTKEIYRTIKERAIDQISEVADRIDYIIGVGGLSGGEIRLGYLVHGLKDKQNYRVVLGLRERILGAGRHSKDPNVKEHYYLMEMGQCPVTIAYESMATNDPLVLEIFKLVVAKVENPKIFSQSKNWRIRLSKLALSLNLISMCEYCEFGRFASPDADSKYLNFIECRELFHINEVQRKCPSFKKKKKGGNF